MESREPGVVKARVTRFSWLYARSETFEPNKDPFMRFGDGVRVGSHKYKRWAPCEGFAHAQAGAHTVCVCCLGAHADKLRRSRNGCERCRRIERNPIGEHRHKEGKAGEGDRNNHRTYVR